MRKIGIAAMAFALLTFNVCAMEQSAIPETGNSSETNLPLASQALAAPKNFPSVNANQKIPRLAAGGYTKPRIVNKITPMLDGNGRQDGIAPQKTHSDPTTGPNLGEHRHSGIRKPAMGCSSCRNKEAFSSEQH